MMTALLVIQIMPVKYSIVKDQTPSSLVTVSRTPKIVFSAFFGKPEKATFGFFVWYDNRSLTVAAQ